MQDHIRIPLTWRGVTRDIASGPHLFERFQYDGLYRFPTFQMCFLSLSHALADEFHFRVVDARRSVDHIQDELRKQVSAFLEPTEKPQESALTR